MSEGMGLNFSHSFHDKPPAWIRNDIRKRASAPLLQTFRCVLISFCHAVNAAVSAVQAAWHWCFHLLVFLSSRFLNCYSYQPAFPHNFFFPFLIFPLPVIFQTVFSFFLPLDSGLIYARSFMVVRAYVHGPSQILGVCIWEPQFDIVSPG